MLKSSALYIVIIVSVILAILSASLISVSFYYRLDQLKKIRFDKLKTNLDSGTAILLSQKFLFQDSLKKELFSGVADSVMLSKLNWGVYELNNVYAFEQGDTLKRSFLSGTTFNDLSSLYLVDEDRPLNISGKTEITGDVEIPESGIRRAYIDGVGYKGQKDVNGKIGKSQRKLPDLNNDKLNYIYETFDLDGKQFYKADSVVNSFFNSTLILHLKLSQTDLEDIKISGRVIIISDTIIRIGKNVVLDNALIFAPVIQVADNVEGTCQLFARDSLTIGKNCVFNYPSFAGVFKIDEKDSESKLSLSAGGIFNGTLLTYTKSKTGLEPVISIGKGTKINGQIFASGPVMLESPVTVFGKTTARKVLLKKASLIYDNYLIDIVLNRGKLNKHYLSTPIFVDGSAKYDVVKWLK